MLTRTNISGFRILLVLAILAFVSSVTMPLRLAVADDFENSPLDASPAPGWIIASGAFRVSDSPVRAPQGNRYAFGTADTRVFLPFGSNVSAGKVSIKFSLFLTSPGAGSFDIGLIRSPPISSDVVAWNEKRVHIEVCCGTENEVTYAYSAPAAERDDTGLDVARDQWQPWEIEYDFCDPGDDSDDKWTLMIDGESAGPFPGMFGEEGAEAFRFAGGGPIGALSFAGDGQPTFYVDTVSIDAPNLNASRLQTPVKEVRNYLDVYLEVLDVGSRKQLLIDDHALIEKIRAKRVFHPARKTSDRPMIELVETDDRILVPMGAVFDERLDRFRLWYTSGDTEYRALCYAESEDGIHWTRRASTPDGKPLDGDVPFNTVWVRNSHDPDQRGITPPNQVEIHYDPHDEDPARRFKMLHGHNRIHLAHSADGYTWTSFGSTAVWNPPLKHLGRSLSPTTTNEGGTTVYDPFQQRWLAFMRDRWATQMRVIVQYQSRDALHWFSLNKSYTTDRRDGPGAQFYSMKTFVYEDMFIGLPNMFFTDEHPREDWRDRLHIGLALSRDGVHWSRPWREPLVARGAPGTWDGGMIDTACCQPVVRGERIYFYYGGAAKLHAPNAPADAEMIWATGCATLRRDGFASLEASETEGEPAVVMTKLLDFDGDRLQLNADATDGDIRIDLLAAGYSVGLGTDDSRASRRRINELSDPITTDSLQHIVTWNGNADVSRLRDQRVRVRFHIAGKAKLYAFQFVEE